MNWTTPFVWCIIDKLKIYLFVNQITQRTNVCFFIAIILQYASFLSLHIQFGFQTYIKYEFSCRWIVYSTVGCVLLH